MNNGDLAIGFAWFRDQIMGKRKGTRKGTSEIKWSIEHCPFSIKEFYDKHGTLEFACIGNNVGRETSKILEFLLKYGTKEEALQKYRLIRKRCSP